MSKYLRPILFLNLVLLFVPFFLPLWSITLEAPQYPEGLGLYIGISTISGHNPNDLNNINLVNHYIGMKEINPGSIPELSIMPWILGGLILFLSGIIWTKKYQWLIPYTILFTLLAVAGLADFYWWNYEFGHNLDTETAAIIIPDVSYQPPIFGTKQLLNFRTTSLPGYGGAATIISLCLTIVALWLSRKRITRND